MPDQVKCRECGMLALLDMERQTIQTCTPEFRDVASVRNMNGELNYEARPICAVHAHDLRWEIGQKSAEIEILSVINKPRMCDSFVGLVPYLSPKEHADMQLLKEQRDWQRTRDKEERDWREKQSERDRQWRKEDQDEARKEMKAERYKGWAIALWTLAASLITWILSIVFQ